MMNSLLLWFLLLFAFYVVYALGAQSGWFAARPSGTENIYKIYAQSFRGAEPLRRVQEEAQAIVSDAAAAAPTRAGLAPDHT